MNLGLFGYLTIIVGVLELVFAAGVFVFVRRLERRTPGTCSPPACATRPPQS